MAVKQLSDRIISDPAILGGKPTIKGTRISVELVLEYLAEAPEELYEAFPHITPEDVKACLEYAHKLVEAQKNYHNQAQV